LLGGLLGGLLGVGQPAHATLTIIPTFDSSITSLPGAAVVEGAINAAIGAVENSITSPNNINVSIYFTSTGNSGLGESFTTIFEPTYFQYYNAFKAVATQPDQLTALASLGPAPVNNASGNPVNGNPNIIFTSAEGRNLGFATQGGVLPNSNINNATCCTGTFDSEIGLATGITSPPNGLSGSTFSLQAVANHEIDEVLGVGGAASTLTGSGALNGPVGDLDLYRYDGNGSRSYSNADPKQPYFSINGGATALSFFNQVVGADFADWQSNPDHAGFGPQLQDAFGTPGVNIPLGPNEITAFNAIGYDVMQVAAAPEPGTLALLSTSLLGLAALRRRRQ
jgi:hypothetical protein